MTEHLISLNPEQRAAAEHFEGPILVLAGAGSGKTRVLTTRIAHLVQELGVDPASILAVTFTNKAAGEMRARIRRLLGREPAGMWMGTFHSLGARLLRRHAPLLGWASNFSIHDADQALRETKRAMDRLNVSTKRWHPKAVHNAISAAKNQLIGPDEYNALAADPFSRVVADIYPVYGAALKEQNAFDFDDLLVKPVTLFETHARVLDGYRQRFRFVLVDEYQDTNRAQYRFLQLLASEHGNLMVVGDDDQSIYGWRGADIRNILDFEQDFPGAAVVRLEQNYRSTGRILDAANAVISLNLKRKGKTLRTDAGPGELLTRVESVDERDEAEWIAGEVLTRLGSNDAASARDLVVLYRTNSQSRALEEAFRRHDLPYQIVGGTRFYERREIMDVLAYLRLISNPRDAGAFDRVVNYPKRGIGDTSQTRLLEWASTHDTSPLEAALRAHEIDAVRGGASISLVVFAELIGRFTALARHLDVGELLEKLLEELRLQDALLDEGPEGEERWENVRELIAGAHEFDARRGEDDEQEPEDLQTEASALDLFLQKVSLLTDVDRADTGADAITLMTLHNAKGLEFPYVFISGMEEGLFPLKRAYDDPDTLEEERRLFYVGITRAERKVYFTHARMRRRGGSFEPSIASSFLEAVPEALMEARATDAVESIRRQMEAGRRRRAASSWGAGSLGYRDTGHRTPRFDDDDGSGVFIDYSDAQDAPRFVKGERVRHPHFGRGVIRELSGFGADLKATIEFERVGRKKVVLRFANLQKEL
ncbi:MAG: ATP-dependent helicase [Longimicrobiales bacterium]